MERNRYFQATLDKIVTVDICIDTEMDFRKYSFDSMLNLNVQRDRIQRIVKVRTV